MSIIFGSDAGIRDDSFDGFVGDITDTFNKVADTVKNAIEGKGPPAPPRENVHVDTGFANVPGTSFVGSTVDNVDDIKQRHIISQEPSMTVYIKKRAFWGLKSENESKFMDSGEKLFMRSSKILFEKKCNQIASYEALTKLSKLVTEDAGLDAQHIAEIMELIKTVLGNSHTALDDSAGAIKSRDPDNLSFVATIDESLLDQKNTLSESAEDLLEYLSEIKKKQATLSQATNTTWVIDPNTKDISGVGRGSGVIELTLVSNASTSLGIQGGGTINFTAQDPYNLMKITTDDVEIAVSAAKLESDIFNDSDKYGGQVELKGAATILDEARSKEEILRNIRENKIASILGFDRTIVGKSSMAEIVFEINPTSSATDRVVAYTTSVDVPPFNKDSFRIAMLQLPAEQQLTSEEDDLVVQIFELLGDYVDAVQSINTRIIDNNKDSDVTYARRHMRAHYLGKSIIQPMDSVHVYMRGNTVKHNEIVGPLSTILNNSSFIDEIAKNSDVSDAVIEAEMEQFDISGLKIPVEFYKAMRTSSFMRNAGTHVFGGVVSSVSESYNASNGTYVLNVNGESNLKWLNLSRVNTSPSLAQPKGMLEDPLTPFDYKTDEATGLITKEPPLLSMNIDAMNDNKIRDKHGVGNGALIRNKSDGDQDQIPFEEKMRIVWKHAPGVVYQWKHGVAVATYDVNLSTSLQGKENDLAFLTRYVGLTLVDQPFSGLDAADIVSLLVTGYPHSAGKFYDNAKGIGTFTTAGSNAAPSYFHSFFDITRTTNNVLGNFRPFRAVGLDGRLAARRLSLQTFLKEGYTKVDQLRSEVAANRDRLLSIDTRPEGIVTLEILRQNVENAEKIYKDTGSDAPVIEAQRIFDENVKSEGKRDLTKRALKDVIGNLESRIRTELGNLAESANQAKEDKVIADTRNIVFKLDEIPTGLPSEAQEETEKSIRLRNKVLQVRTQHDCKFGTDENLFIVSDHYDNDREIQAFVSRLKQQQNLFNSQYQHPIEICNQVAETLDFEFFCDTMGHIQFRPPQYNRVPLSLVLKMFLLNNKNGVQLYPEFLKKMFNTKLETLQNEAQALDSEIKIDALSLNMDIQKEEATKILQKSASSEDITGNVYFTTNTDPISKNDVVSCAEAIVAYANQIEGLTGRKSELQDIDKTTEHILALNDPKNIQVNSQRLRVANRLQSLVSKKQQIDTLLSKLESRANKFKEAEPFTNFSSKEAGDFLAPYQDLIEDDFNDFLGPGSSKRFIIYDDQIIRSDFTESDKNAYCRVDVNGQHDFIGAPGEIVQGLPSVWAGATDFDMWRMYGYRALPTQVKPFLKDAKDQCAPYALFLLARAKQDVVTGSITIPGNEYYQLGDVIYINSRDMLFYVWNVKHDFSYEGGTFTTTLECKYGHSLGEYIPTPLDVIGKQLIRDQEKFNRTLVSRETTSDVGGIHLGLVIFENEASDNERKAMLTEPNARTNITELKRSLLVARNYIHSTKPEDFPKVEVRGWIDSDDDREKVENRMAEVISWLQHPSGRWLKYSSEDRYIEIKPIYYDSKLDDNHITNKVFKIDDEHDNVTAVNLAKDLVGEDKSRLRIPNEEVYNVSQSREPYNIIEIVLLLK